MNAKEKKILDKEWADGWKTVTNILHTANIEISLGHYIFVATIHVFRTTDKPAHPNKEYKKNPFSFSDLSRR